MIFLVVISSSFIQLKFSNLFGDLLHWLLFRAQELAGSNDEDNEQARSPGNIHDIADVDENEPDVALPTSNNLDEQQTVAQLFKKRKRDEYDLPPIQGIKCVYYSLQISATRT